MYYNRKIKANFSLGCCPLPFPSLPIPSTLIAEYCTEVAPLNFGAQNECNEIELNSTSVLFCSLYQLWTFPGAPHCAAITSHGTTASVPWYPPLPLASSPVHAPLQCKLHLVLTDFLPPSLATLVHGN